MSENRKKICFAITKGNWGGAQRYVYDLATSLPKDQFEAVVICGKGETLPKKLEEAHVKTYRLPYLSRNISIISEIRSSWNLLKTVYKERPDVLHLNSPKAAGFGAVAGRLCGVNKIIYTVHGFAFNEDRNFFSKSIISFFSWVTILLSHKTIVIAKREEKQVLAMPFVKNKVILIHNGIEKIDFKEKNIARGELLTRIGESFRLSLTLETLWLGTIAELHKNKGLEYVIPALFKITTPFVFFIIGEGEERENLETLVAKYNLQEKIFLIGFMEKANQYLKAFDIFTLTSTKEGLPYTLIEAGQAGVPSIASSVGGIPDIIENGVNGILVTTARSGEITRAIEYLVQNPDKQKEFGQNLKQKGLRDFSIEQMLEKTISLYKKQF